MRIFGCDAKTIRMIAVFLTLCAIITIAALYHHSWLGRVPPIPLRVTTRRALIALIPPGNGPIYELGCGFGFLAINLARTFPARPIVAIEYSPLPFAVAWLWARVGGYKNLRVWRGDFLATPIPAGAVCTSYLYPALMPPLRDHLRAQMGPITLLNVNFPIPDMHPTHSITVPRRDTPMPDEILVYGF